MRPFAPLLILLAIPLLLIVAVQQEQRRNEHRLANIASHIAGRDVTVHCPGLLSRLADVSAHAGTVFFDEHGQPADFTDLDEETCSELDRFAEGKSDQGEQAKVARALRCNSGSPIWPGRLMESIFAVHSGSAGTGFWTRNQSRPGVLCRVQYSRG